MRLARIALLTSLITGTVHAADPLDDPVLYAEVQRLAAMLTDGFATLDHADTVVGTKGSVLSDHVIVMLAMTSWGGGNGSQQFMAVFRHSDPVVEFPDGRRSRPYQFLGLVQVGSDSDRWFKNVELRQDRVILTGRRWAKGDAHCCPSIPAHAVYRIGEHGVNEVIR